MSPDRLSAALLAIAGSIVFITQVRGAARWWLAAASLLAGGLTFALRSVSRNRACLRLDGGEVLYTSLRGQRAVLANGQAGKVVQLRTSTVFGHASSWCIVDQDGTTKLALSTKAWNEIDLETFRQARGLPLEVVVTPDVQSATEELPGLLPRLATSWLERPWTFAFGFVFAVIALVGAIEIIIAKA